MNDISLNNLALLLISISGLAYAWFGGSHIAGIHIPPIVTAITSYVVLIILLQKPQLYISPSVKTLSLITLFIVGYMFIRELIAGASLATIFKVLIGRIAIGPVIAYSILFLTNNHRKLQYLSWSLIAWVTISATVGIGQYFVGGFFIKLWSITGGLLSKEAELENGRNIAGLAYFSVPFGYQLSTVLPLVFSFLISGHIKYRKVLLVIFIILFIALFLSGVRSAILGTIIGLGVVMKSLGRKGAMKCAFLIVLFGVLSYVFWGFYLNPRFITINEFSTLTRIPLFITALMVGFTHPMGTGRERYMETAASFYELVSDLPGAIAVFEHTSHNQFLNMLAYYGWPGLLLLIMFYILLFRLLLLTKVKTIDNNFLNAMRIGLLGGFAAYFINSLFHNAGPFIGDPFNWYFIGLAFALSSIRQKSFINFFHKV